MRLLYKYNFIGGISIMFGVQQNLIHQSNHQLQIQQQSVKDT